jgi:hypothetical protein
MPEIDSQLPKERKRIQRRSKKSLRNVVYSFLCFVLFAVLSSLSGYPSIHELNFAYYAVIIASFIFLLGWLFFFFKSTTFRLSFEDLTFLKVYKLLEELEMYFIDKNEECRKKAERRVNILMSDLDSLKGGSLKVYQNELGPHITSFKEAFYRKLVGAIKQHEKNDLEKSFNILTDLAKFLCNENARIADLDLITEKMNKEISVTLPPKTPKKLTLSNVRTFHYFNDVLACVISLVIGVVAGVGGKYGFNVSNDISFTMAVTIVLGLVGVYFGYIRKGQK